MTTKEELEFFVANHGKECEFSDDREDWKKDVLIGYDSSEMDRWRGESHDWIHCRPIQEPEYIPWSKETFVFQPIDFGDSVKVPAEWDEDIIYFVEYTYHAGKLQGKTQLNGMSWVVLLKEGKTLSGEPCGVRSEK